MPEIVGIVVEPPLLSAHRPTLFAADGVSIRHVSSTGWDLVSSPIHTEALRTLALELMVVTSLRAARLVLAALGALQKVLELLLAKRQRSL